MAVLSALNVPNTLLAKPQTHPLEPQVSQEVNSYFLEHWPFPSEKARSKFIGAGFPRVACMYFPLALDDRIHFACRLLTLLFLVDDLLEHLSLKDGSEYNETLLRISRGDQVADRSVAVEYMTQDLWESMRAHDVNMANDIIEPVAVFMRAQTDSARLKPMTMGEYLRYREKDVGRALLEALMRFSMALHVPANHISKAAVVNMTVSKHLSVINDIWSYEKELKASKNLHEEGGVLCSAVAILAEDTDLTIPASKRVLYNLCREWETEFKQSQHDLLQARDMPQLRPYLLGLEYQMSGNEFWSKTTERYKV